MAPVSLDAILAARERLRGVVLQTPLLPAWSFDSPGDNEVWLKAENLQRTGSFKIRGAYNAISTLPESERACGVITYSSGNHGQAVACAAHLLGVPAVVVMPEDAVPLKIEATRTWGAEVIFSGTSSLERQERALELVQEHGYTVIPPFDDARIIAGQGTAGIEMLEQQPDLAAVVVPCGGGGLLSGIATAVKALRPDVRVVGVEPEGAADARDSVRQGHIVTWDKISTVADGLRTSRIGELNFATLNELVDDMVTVTEQQIELSMGLLASQARLVVEPSGAVATAAVLAGKTGVSNARVAAVISGGNVAPESLVAAIATAAQESPATVSV